MKMNINPIKKAMNNPNPIVELSFSFALKVIQFSELLQSKKKFLMADQFWRCGTAIGAHVREAQGAESRADFIHKMKIAYKEAQESDYWLALCEGSSTYPSNTAMREDLVSITKILGKIISSSKP
jgi:four helix bundle protein